MTKNRLSIKNKLNLRNVLFSYITPIPYQHQFSNLYRSSKFYSNFFNGKPEKNMSNSAPQEKKNLSF